MKKVFTFLLSAGFLHTNGQTVMASWNFSASNTTASGGLAANAASTLTSGGGTSAINYQVAPAPPVAVPYQSASGWDAGAGTKFWQTTISTIGYSLIAVNSVQRSSNTGPANFTLQANCGAGFTNVTSLVLANNWTIGVVNNVALPTACNNNATVIIRWLVTTTTAVNAGTVAIGGTSGIDDISVTAATVLPISFKNFTAKKNNNAVNLNWLAASTDNTSYFIVEKSSDGNNYTTLTKVNALTGENNYAFADNSANTGNAFYRIKLADADGSFKFSNVLRVKTGGKTFSLNSIYPTLASSQINLQVSSDKKTNASIEIIDINGRLLKKQTLILNDGIITYPLNVSSLSAGAYLVRITVEEEILTGRFSK
jgi:hypothetical protein